ncbi:MAG TPA: CAAX prenyl protease-related protein [Kiritimatiellia bacterium]|nr:CAAX prenyl protease-related protein [Kiritimatiellia bacterium]
MNVETATKPQNESLERPTLAHIVPFVAWLFIAHLLGDPDGWKYAVRSVVCLGLFVWLRPWRWYSAINFRNVPLAIVVGIAVCIIWVIGESPWVRDNLPWLYNVYGKWGIMPFGELRDTSIGLAYSPSETGWPLTLVRIAGSALVIGVIEEFFWRGWLYRWMLGRNFLKVDPGTFDRFAFFAVAFVFGLEHREWLAGWLAGIAYGWLYWKTRDIWATALAHALTNALLGWYVVYAGAYWFWSG